jgi:hypothetical protein
MPTVPNEESILAGVTRELLNNPATRTRLQSMVKEIHPDQFIPEIDVAQRALAPVNEEVSRLRAELERVTAEREVENRRAQLVSSGKVTARDVPEVEKLMMERGIGDYETAAELLHFQRQAAVPAPTYESTRMRLPTDKADLMRDPRGFAMQSAYDAIAEMSKH